jgi:TetR/AcrR family transcriptional regulator
MKRDEGTKEKILQAAVGEFAASGFAGARMEQIAARAGVNKAMLYYYFGNKKELYKEVLQGVMATILPELARIVTPDLTPERFAEEIPSVYIRFFARHPLHVRLIGYDLIHNPDNIKAAFAEVASHVPLARTRDAMFANFNRWAAEGLIRPVNKMQLMLSIISMSILAFIARPLVEVMSGITVKNDEEFVAGRIESVTALLKKGLLP